MASFKEIATYGGAAIGFSAAAALYFYISGQRLHPNIHKRIDIPSSIQPEIELDIVIEDNVILDVKESVIEEDAIVVQIVSNQEVEVLQANPEDISLSVNSKHLIEDYCPIVEDKKQDEESDWILVESQSPELVKK